MSDQLGLFDVQPAAPVIRPGAPAPHPSIEGRVVWPVLADGKPLKGVSIESRTGLDSPGFSLIAPAQYGQQGFGSASVTLAEILEMAYERWAAEMARRSRRKVGR